MININELRVERELVEYFESLSTWIQGNVESEEDQEVLELFIDKILDNDELSFENQIEAINNGIYTYTQEMFNTKKKPGGMFSGVKTKAKMGSRVGGAKNKYMAKSDSDLGRTHTR